MTVGVMHDFLSNIDQITKIELLAENKCVYQGEACARLTDAKGYIHRIWSPATGRISKTNTDVMQDLTLLVQDPYGKGWLFQLEVTDLAGDIEGLNQN